MGISTSGIPGRPGELLGKTNLEGHKIPSEGPLDRLGLHGTIAAGV